jgi:hypothetical protein
MKKTSPLTFLTTVLLCLLTPLALAATGGTSSSNAAAAASATSAAATSAVTGTGSSSSTATPTISPVLPYPSNQPDADKPLINTTGRSCRCQVNETSGNACMIFMRTNAADWIMKNAPQTRMRSSNDGRFYDTPFDLAASACAGRKVNPGSVKVHWLDRKSAILEW